MVRIESDDDDDDDDGDDDDDDDDDDGPSIAHLDAILGNVTFFEAVF